ncbi:MAG: alpha/beta fold hydrolase, partial [Acidimicrobiales bacterium]
MPCPRPRLRLRRPAIAAGVGAVTLVVGACGGAGVRPGATGPARGSSGAAPAPTPPTTAQTADARRPLRWSACRSGQGPAGFQCATLRVPLDPRDPAKGTIGLALDRHPATGQAVATLVVNPGGPGVSGVDWLGQAWAAFPPVVRRRFAVVGFDPPGVGHSDAVTCGTPRQLGAYLTSDLLPTTPAGWAALAAVDRRFAAGCEARSGRILPYVGTVDAAMDLDLVRAALGEAKLTYLGFSYGTLLGATYAGLFPHRVRAMVLDGAIDPAVGPLALLTQQSGSLERAFAAFAATCAAGRCGWRPARTAAGVTAAYQQLLARTASRPLRVPGGGPAVDRTVLMYATIAGLYYPAGDWTFVGQAIAAAANGDGRPALSMFDSYVGRLGDGRYASTVEAETAVDCEDAAAPPLAAIAAAAP